MASPTRLDRFISYLSPARGAQRLAARRTIEALSYEGARRGRRAEGWSTGTGTSANAEIMGDRLMLRDRVRTLLRDNPWARKGSRTLVANRIGTGIVPTAVGQNQRLNRSLNERHKRWADTCDITGKTDLYGIQAQAESARVESGESMIRLVPLERGESEQDIPLRLQVLEPDHIDTGRNERRENGNEVREGIEYAGQRAVAYWLYPDHPGDTSPMLRRASLKSVRVPASQVIHYYRVERPGQLSGVSEFAPVIRRLYDVDDYADAEVMRKKIAACSVGAVTSPQGLPGAAMAPTEIDSTTGQRKEQLEPGMYHYFHPGETVEFFDPKPTGDYREFMGVELHAIASGLNMPFELLTGDLSEVNYSSIRAGFIQFFVAIEMDRWQLVIPQVCAPIWREFVRAAEMRPGLMVPARFTPPRFQLLDPSKEVQPIIDSIAAGLQSWRETIRMHGEDPNEVLDEIASEREEFASRGISLTSIEPVKKAAPTEDQAAA